MVRCAASRTVTARTVSTAGSKRICSTRVGRVALCVTHTELPGPATTPSSPTGSEYQDAMADFFTKWQEGKVSDINAALKGVDKTINDALALATGP